MLSTCSREIEILHEVAIAPISPHAKKSDYLRDWNTHLATSLRPRINLPTFEGSSQSVEPKYIPDASH